MLNELFVRCYRWQIFHCGGDTEPGNPSLQEQNHLDPESITPGLDVSAGRRSCVYDVTQRFYQDNWSNWRGNAFRVRFGWIAIARSFPLGISHFALPEEIHAKTQRRQVFTDRLFPLGVLAAWRAPSSFATNLKRLVLRPMELALHPINMSLRWG